MGFSEAYQLAFLGFEKLLSPLIRWCYLLQSLGHVKSGLDHAVVQIATAYWRCWTHSGPTLRQTWHWQGCSQSFWASRLFQTWSLWFDRSFACFATLCGEGLVEEFPLEQKNYQKNEWYSKHSSILSKGGKILTSRFLFVRCFQQIDFIDGNDKLPHAHCLSQN